MHVCRGKDCEHKPELPPGDFLDPILPEPGVTPIVTPKSTPSPTPATTPPASPDPTVDSCNNTMQVGKVCNGCNCKLCCNDGCCRDDPNLPVVCATKYRDSCLRQAGQCNLSDSKEQDSVCPVDNSGLVGPLP